MDEQWEKDCDTVIAAYLMMEQYFEDKNLLSLLKLKKEINPTIDSIITTLSNKENISKQEMQRVEEIYKKNTDLMLKIDIMKSSVSKDLKKIKNKDQVINRYNQNR